MNYVAMNYFEQRTVLPQTQMIFLNMAMCDFWISLTNCTRRKSCFGDVIKQSGHLVSYARWLPTQISVNTLFTMFMQGLEEFTKRHSMCAIIAFSMIDGVSTALENIHLFNGFPII